MHTIDHHRTVVKLGAWMSLLHSVGFPYEDKVGKYGWAGEDPPPKALGDMELGWVLGVEVAMTRQLFAAPVLPSSTWHQALLHAWQMAKVAAQNEYPAKPSLQQTLPLLQPDALLLHLSSAPAPGQGNSGGGMCVCGMTVASHSVSSPSLSALDSPGKELTCRFCAPC